MLRYLAPVKEVLEVSRDAHYVAVDDQLAPGAGASAQILSGGDMHLTVGTALDNQYGDIKAKGVLVLDGDGAQHKNNVGATLYRTYSFDGTWTTYDGQTVAYQRPSISEAIGAVAGVIDGEQGVFISGRSFNNIDVTAGTVGNIRDAINVIGSGATGASTAGAHLTAADRGDGPSAATVAAGSGETGEAGLHAEAGASVDATVGTRVDSSSGADGTIGMQFASGAGATGTAGGKVEGSAAGANVGLARMAAAAINGSGLRAMPEAVAGGVTEQFHAGDHLAGDGYANGAKTSSDVAASGAANGLATNGVAHQSGASNDASLAGAVSMARNGVRLDNVSMGAGPSAGQTATTVQGAGMGSATKVAPSGLFVLNPDANGSYVYETRPQFANQQQWTSSEYMLSQFAMDPTVTQKRLGTASTSNAWYANNWPS